MRAGGQKLVKFCTRTHTHTTAAKLVVRLVKSEKPMHTLRQCLNVQYEVASPTRSQKQKYVELAMQDS